jgi:hypothetical protein
MMEVTVNEWYQGLLSLIYKYIHANLLLCISRFSSFAMFLGPEDCVHISCNLDSFSNVQEKS